MKLAPAVLRATLLSAAAKAAQWLCEGGSACLLTPASSYPQQRALATREFHSVLADESQLMIGQTISPEKNI